MALSDEEARRLTERFVGMLNTPATRSELVDALAAGIRGMMQQPSAFRQAMQPIPVPDPRRPDGSPIMVDRTSGPLYTPFRWEEEVQSLRDEHRIRTEETAIERPQQMVEFTAYETLGPIHVNPEAVARVDFGIDEGSHATALRKPGYRTLAEIRRMKR